MKCKDENPTIQVINNGDAKANIKITDNEGKTTAIPELNSGSISQKENYASGKTTFHYKIGSIDSTEIINTNTCVDYNVTINSDHEIVLFSKKRK